MSADVEEVANILHIDNEDIKCFLCNEDFNSGDKSFLIFNERVQSDGSFDCPLAHILSAALGFELEEATAHSTLLCSNCNLIVLAFEKLERKLFALRTRITSDYDKTIKDLEKLANEVASADKLLHDENSTVEFIEDVDEEILGLESETTTGTMFEDLGQDVDEDARIYEDTNAKNIAEEQVEEFEEKFMPDFEVSNETLTESNDNNVDNEDMLESQQTKNIEAEDIIQLNAITNTNKQQLYTCQFCDSTFENLQILGKHFDEQHAESMSDYHFECEVCRLSFENYSALLEHVSSHYAENSYTCELCSKSFGSKYSLQVHKKTHSDRLRPFKCDQCGKEFMIQQTLRQHKKTHAQFRAFVCEICNKNFATQHNLDAHGITHSGIRPYHCQTCGKSFARKAEMTDHERIHASDPSVRRPFKCEYCDLSFTQRSNLTAHVKITHFNEKMHKCDLCERSFKRRRLLEYHKNAAHTGERPYKCDKCSSSFVYKEHYKKHLIIHTGEKPYACEVCNKRFNSRDNRNAHRFVHSDKKPYECVECGAGFMRKPLLLAHMKHSRHINDTIIVNQPQINGGVLQTATIMMSSTEEAADEPQEMIIDHLDDASQSQEMNELPSSSKVIIEKDAVKTEKSSDDVEAYKSMVKIDDFVVSWQDIAEEEEEV